MSTAQKSFVKISNYFTGGKSSGKIYAIFVTFIKLPKVNNDPKSEDYSILVTLLCD
jgi:hypothetical protein